MAPCLDAPLVLLLPVQKPPIPDPVKEFLHWLKEKEVKVEWNPNPNSEKQKAYIPISLVRKHLQENNDERLENLLYALYKDEDHLIPNFRRMMSKCVAMLCILTRIGRGAEIHHFLRHRLYDAYLPLNSEVETKGFPPDNEFYKLFCQEQWTFFAPDFPMDMYDEFDADYVLPITFENKDSPTLGGSAEIRKIRIHNPYDQLLPTSTRPRSNVYALKTYCTPDAQNDYQNEVNVLRKLNLNNHPHIIHFYGNFKYGNTYNVILEYADQGNLEEYFKTQPPPSLPEDIVKFWNNLFGILKALHTLHMVRVSVKKLRSANGESKVLHGWHQDLKPENILVLSNKATSPYEYTFKLADFGLSRVQKPTEDGRAGTTVELYGNATYGAPECSRLDPFWHGSNIEVFQTIDIWSFGCILSEAAVWMHKDGYKGLKEYRDERLDATSKLKLDLELSNGFHTGVKVLPVVLDWHKRVRGTLDGSNNITDRILGTIETEMLQEKTSRSDANKLSRWWLSQLAGIHHPTPNHVDETSLLTPEFLSNQRRVIKKCEDGIDAVETVLKKLSEAQEDLDNGEYRNARLKFREARKFLLQKCAAVPRKVTDEQLLNAFTGLTKSELLASLSKKDEQKRKLLLQRAEYYAGKASELHFCLNRSIPCVALALYEDAIRSTYTRTKR
ncbi:kinase-like protein [Acephala macrosclerotiorum]|nr:kinase-like protein [Acephala macrosclerotiorum]